MGLKPLSVRQIVKQTEDVYEAVVVMATRAKQILRDRMVEKVMKETEQDDFGVFDQVLEVDPESYKEQEKPSTIAVSEFIDDKLEWQKRSDEEE